MPQANSCSPTVLKAPCGRGPACLRMCVLGSLCSIRRLSSVMCVCVRICVLCMYVSGDACVGASAFTEVVLRVVGWRRVWYYVKFLRGRDGKRKGTMSANRAWCEWKLTPPYSRTRVETHLAWLADVGRVSQARMSVLLEQNRHHSIRDQRISRIAKTRSTNHVDRQKIR